MVLLRIKSDHFQNSLTSTCRVLRAGGVIALPTETVYGLGCDPRNEKAAKRIFEIKQRDKTFPVLMVVGSLAQARRFVSMNSTTIKLVKRYWPGPLTLVLPAQSNISQEAIFLPHKIKAGDGIGIRYSSSPFVQALTKAYRYPIIATSANFSGQAECRSGKAVWNLFQDAQKKPDLIIDIGALPKRKSSTVIKVFEDGMIEVLRQGGIRISNEFLHDTD